MEKSSLGFEIADLKNAVEALDRPFAPIRQGTLGVGQGEELCALKIVEIW